MLVLAPWRGKLSILLLGGKKSHEPSCNCVHFLYITGGIGTNAKDRTPWQLWTKGPREYFIGCVFDFRLNEDYDYLDLPRYSRNQVKCQIVTIRNVHKVRKFALQCNELYNYVIWLVVLST